jgi:hypothetical protein
MLDRREKEIVDAVVRLCVAGLKPLGPKNTDLYLDSTWHNEFLSPTNSALRMLAESIGLTGSTAFFPSLDDSQDMEHPRTLEEVRTKKVLIHTKPAMSSGEDEKDLETSVLVNFLIYHHDKTGFWSLEIVSSSESVFRAGRHLKAGGKNKSFGWRFGVKNIDVLRYVDATCKPFFDSRTAKTDVPK